MVATIGQMATAEYYLESQRSFRHPNEYYTAGEEPDGTWFNPKGLFGLEDGAKVDSAEFQRLYTGFSPDGSGKLVQRAGNPDRSPGVDLTFSVDKSVSSLWAIAEPGMRQRIEAMAVAAGRAALEDSVLRYCSYTLVSANGVTRPAEADLMGATFVHGTSRENDPQLHVHCTIFNLARTKEDGKWRAHHQYPVYSWKKAAGALFRAYMAWDLQQDLGVRMEQYGPNAEFTRIAGMPEELQAFWSKRRKAIVAKAGELGIPSLGNASRMAGVNKLTRAGKSHDNDPEIRHRRWRQAGTSTGGSRSRWRSRSAIASASARPSGTSNSSTAPWSLSRIWRCGPPRRTRSRARPGTGKPPGARRRRTRALPSLKIPSTSPRGPTTAGASPSATTRSAIFGTTSASTTVMR